MWQTHTGACLAVFSRMTMATRGQRESFFHISVWMLQCWTGVVVRFWFMVKMFVGWVIGGGQGGCRGRWCHLNSGKQRKASM